MTETRSQVLQAYDLVILRVKAVYRTEHGHEHGALRWFAAQLDITPQTLDNWGKRAGILPGYVDQVAKLTGLKKIEVRPDTILFEATNEDWAALSKGRPKDLLARITIHPLRRKYG